MATRQKNRKRHQQSRQKDRPDRRAERRLLWKALFHLAWIGFGLGAIFYLLRDPQNNWLGIFIWLAGYILWMAHVAMRWLFRWLEARSARVR